MTGLSLPTSLAAAIPSIRWPLGPSSCPPLYFESLENMKAIRKKSTEATPLDAILSDLPESLESLVPTTTDSDQRYFGLISMALFFLGHGLTDEAHDIVTPLSWPEDTHFGYGPSIYSSSQVSPSAKSYATYVHCLVHRREAFNVGEFGMPGFSNANYWSNAVLRSTGVGSLPHQDLRQEIGQLIRENDSIPGVKEWCQNHDFLQDGDDSPYFESRAVHELCASVLKGSNPQLQDFAERVAETELRVLLAHALQNAGYDSDLSTVLQRSDGNHAEMSVKESGAEVMPPSINENAALSAARRVSSAHLNMFQTGGSVTIRSVQNDDQLPISAAAGIACRLLESPACRVVESSPFSSKQVVRIYLPSSSEEAERLSSQLSANDIYLSPGDLYAVQAVEPDEVCDEGPCYTFAACDASDARATHVDRLFGSRGETPTTVVQWSKGTIF